ncbi:unnamed protein product [Merluccius merluccius]
MKEQKLKQEVDRIQQEVPCARQALLDNFNNLLNVAEYCNTNYLQSGASSVKALEETKSFASQSLASVVYQISTLANSLLVLLDAQTNQIGHMESSIHLIGQVYQTSRTSDVSSPSISWVSFGKPAAPPTESDIMANKAPPKDDDVTGVPAPPNSPPFDLPVELLAPPTSTEFLSNHNLPPPPSPPASLEPGRK